ncbi:MAG: QueT transporter family protein, partial [Veillonella sp.]|nr:QueT transporter family protein [Veillonella sp.]
LAYAFPFLIVPMGIGNLISNFLFGGLGILDMVGGFGVGILTTGIIVLMRRAGLSAWWAMLPIILVPALCVPLWLSPLVGVPYWALVINLLIGQTIPGIVGATLVKALASRRTVAALMNITYNIKGLTFTMESQSFYYMKLLENNLSNCSREVLFR